MNADLYNKYKELLKENQELKERFETLETGFSLPNIGIDYFSILNSVDSAILLLENLKIAYANTKAISLFKADNLSDIIDSKYIDFVSEAYSTLVEFKFDKLIKGEKISSSEEEFTTLKTKEKFRAIASYSILKHDEKSYILVSFNDVPAWIHENAVLNFEQREQKEQSFNLIFDNFDNLSENQIIELFLRSAISISSSERSFFYLANEKSSLFDANILIEKYSETEQTLLFKDLKPENSRLIQLCSAGKKALSLNSCSFEIKTSSDLLGEGLIKKTVVAPLFINNSLIAIAGVANSPTDYDDSVVTKLYMLLNKTIDALNKKKKSIQTEKNIELFDSILTNTKNSCIVFFSKNGEPAKSVFDAKNHNIVFIKDLIESNEIANIMNKSDKDYYRELFVGVQSGLPGEMSLFIENCLYYLTFTPLLTKNNDVEYTYYIRIIDLSNTLKNAESLNSSEEKYKNLIERASDGIMIIQDGKIIYANLRIQKMLGMPLDKVIGEKFTSIYSPTEAAKIVGYYNARKNNEIAPNIFETNLKHKSGTLIPVEQSASIITQNGETAELVFIRDIRQRVKNRIALNKLSLVVENSPNTIIITDSSGIIEYVNNNFEILTGYSREDALGKKPSILKSGFTPDDVYTDMWRTITSGKEWTGEFINKKKNGQIFTERTTIFSIKDTDSKIINYIATKEDITDKKKKDEELLLTNNNLKLLNECYVALLHAEDKSELFFAFCDIIVNILHYEVAFICNAAEPKPDDEELNITIQGYSSFRNFIHIDSEQEISIPMDDCSFAQTILNSSMNLCYQTEDCGNCAKAFTYKDFKRAISLPISNAHFPRLYLAGLSNINQITDLDIHLISEVVSYLSFGLDILFEKLERKRVENLHILEKEQLNVTLNSIADGVITLDKEGQISYINKTALRMLHKEPEEALNKSFFDVLQLLDERDQAITYNPYDYIDLKLDSPSAKTRFTIKRSDGKIKYVNIVSNKIIDANGSFIGIVLAIRDITKIVKIEAQSALSQKMESVGQLAAGIAHEINTPMQFVGDNTFFIRDSFPSFIEFIEKSKEYFSRNRSELDREAGAFLDELIEKNDLEYLSSEIPIAIDRTLEGIDRVRRIVIAMKNFAHSSGKVKSKSNLNQGIEVTVTISKNEWKYNSELIANLNPNLPLVYCSLDEINQVVLNMIINSAHSIIEKKSKKPDFFGEIKVSTEFDDSKAYIIIQDNGCGIDKDKFNRIFDPFYTTKEVGKGTGQGLAIAHDIIVNKHKGLIEVESESGEGAKFIISLPIGE
jgi:PAS domain S-box-containing protein